MCHCRLPVRIEVPWDGGIKHHGSGDEGSTNRRDDMYGRLTQFRMPRQMLKLATATSVGMGWPWNTEWAYQRGRRALLQWKQEKGEIGYKVSGH